MKAVVWHGKRDVRVETVPDPTYRTPTDAIVRITSSGLCGSDLHLYEVLAPFMTDGDILGHEPMGIVEAVGAEVTDIAVGDRVVIPFNISCGQCFMCDHGLQSQCETTQNVEHGTGASLFGYTKLYGQVPGAQAELLRVPQAQYGPIKVPDGPSDDRFLFLSDILPTAWQGVEYARCPRVGASLCWASVRSATSPVASHNSAASITSSGSILFPNGSSVSVAAASRCSMSTSSQRRTTCSPPSTSSPMVAARTLSSTLSAWRPTAPRPASSPTRSRRSCPTVLQRG